jgi:large subunit GTPase 1
VAATPGKTKHFQTLIVSEALLLCDCPGLVLPRYAQSKAEMVAAGAAGHPTLDRSPCSADVIACEPLLCIRLTPSC